MKQKHYASSRRPQTLGYTLKHEEPYYWDVNRIVEEYELIQEKKSKLSSRQRQTVVHIYNEKKKRGQLPAQKIALMKEAEECNKALAGALKKLLEKLGAPDNQNVVSQFTIIVVPPDGDEIMNYQILFKGAFIGWVKVYRGGDEYMATYSTSKDDANNLQD